MRGPWRFSALATAWLLAACGAAREPAGPALASPLAGEPALFWNSATVYFLLTDRFDNGDPSNDGALGRAKDGAVLRTFEGGDLAGLLGRLRAGWFDSLGVTAIWLTPFVEQVHGRVDEGTGWTYGYHGYWTRDWTAVDPALGTVDDLRAVVDEAHRRGIRVLMDAVLNHTGPVTPQDPAWPGDWVRTGPRCRYQDYATTTACTLVDNLPDILTGATTPVDPPPALVAKWEAEGRLEGERAELDAFFARTGYPRTPPYYLIKWLTDWVREIGFDGYRVDTVKHFEEALSAALRAQAEHAFASWKAAHPAKVIDSLPFYMMGEVYGWDARGGRGYDFGDRTVDYFAHGYDGLINFGFKHAVAGNLDSAFAAGAASLADGALRGVTVVNYLASHDDGGSWDRERQDPMGAAVRLLLAPGGAQVYYGDELARPLWVAGAEGDANLRSFMNWEDLEEGTPTAAVLDHWRRIGRFRRAHPAVGAGRHVTLQATPHVFGRILEARTLDDRVVVGLDQPDGRRTLPVAGVFEDGARLEDAYSGHQGRVRNGTVTLEGGGPVVLLQRVVGTRP